MAVISLFLYLLMGYLFTFGAPVRWWRELIDNALLVVGTWHFGILFLIMKHHNTDWLLMWMITCYVTVASIVGIGTLPCKGPRKLRRYRLIMFVLCTGVVLAIANRSYSV